MPDYTTSALRHGSIQALLKADPVTVTSIGKVHILSEADMQSFREMAAKGALIAASNPQVAAARALNPDGRFRWGFDIASGITQGMSVPGPGQTMWRNKLGPQTHRAASNGTDAGSDLAMQGYDVGQALQHGITKAQDANKAAAIAAAPPNVGAGMLIAEGVAGSGSPANIKAGVIQQTMADAGTLQGASQVIAEKQGFFAKVLAFFGL